MSKDLMFKIADDLNIIKFKNENDESYLNRILYSACSLWLKTICLDGISNTTQSNHSISKHYHHTRGEFIINNLLEFFPQNRAWFENNENIHSVNFLRERLIKSMDILQLNDDSRLYIHENDFIPINSNFSKIYGIPKNNNNIASGISLLQNRNNENYKICYENIEFFYNEFIENIVFTKDEWLQGKIYFNPLVKTDTIYKSWTDGIPNSNVYISKLENENGSIIYFIEKIEDGVTYSHRINDFIIESGILIKMLYYLRSINHNPINVIIEKMEDNFILKRFVKNFYGKEEKFIQEYGWPIDSLYDNLNWRFPIYFYDDIIDILENLFIKVKEV